MRLTPTARFDMLLTVRDETAGGSLTNELTLDLPDETITVRELIRSRVYQEVDDFNRKLRSSSGPGLRFNGLVTPGDTERTLNAAAPRQARQIDWKKQFAKACEAFEHNGFFVLVGDRQADSLDETIVLSHERTATFVKLVPLVGG